MFAFDVNQRPCVTWLLALWDSRMNVQNMYPFDVMPFTDATGARHNTFFFGSGGTDLPRNNCCLHFISAVYTWMFCGNLNIFIVNVYLLFVSVLQENLLKIMLKMIIAVFCLIVCLEKHIISVYGSQKYRRRLELRCHLKKVWNNITNGWPWSFQNQSSISLKNVFAETDIVNTSSDIHLAAVHKNN